LSNPGGRGVSANEDAAVGGAVAAAFENGKWLSLIGFQEGVLACEARITLSLHRAPGTGSIMVGTLYFYDP
jgi:hypothetical protein